VPSNDKGIAKTEISVVRKLARKRKSTKTTHTAPSMSERPTLFTDD
jgi:hypothetical protein